MNRCEFPRASLTAFLDDELDPRACGAREHLKSCRECAAEVERWRASGDRLREIVDAAVGDIEPLMALEKIHARISAADEMPLFDRLRRAVAELFVLNRRVFAGVAIAASLGAVSTPFVVYWLGRTDVEQVNPFRAAVVVEPLEVGGATTALAHAAPVLIDLKIIHAHNKSKTIDPSLEALVDQLKNKKLSFTGYTLKDEAVFNLDLGAAGRMQLPNGEWMVVTPLAFEAEEKLKLELSVDKLKLKSIVAISPGASLVVGGPPFDDGEIVVAVSRPKETPGAN